MKRLLITLFLLLPSLAYGQGVTKLCYSAPSGNSCYDVNMANPLPVVGGGLDGSLAVNTQPYPELFDAFSSTLDTTTNWTANNSTGTAATASGSLVISSSATNAAWGGVGSKQSWAPSGISPQIFGVSASFGTIAIANTSRVFGAFTVPGTPTITVPATDGYLFRLDSSGSLFAEVWASGVATSSTDITAACPLTAGIPNLYSINFRTSLVVFTCGNVKAATVLGINPNVQTLPVSLFSIAGTSPGATATASYSGLTLVTYAPAGVKEAGQAPTTNDPSLVVTISPNSPALTVTTASATGTLTNRSGTIATGGTAQTLAAINATRKYIFIENPCAATESLWINFTTAAVVSQPSIEIPICGSFLMSSSNFVSTELVSVIATTSAHAFIAKEN